MAIYTEKQLCWLIIGISVSTVLLITLVCLYQWGQSPLSLFPYLIILPIIILPALLFFQMHTTVDSSQITIRYGIGWVKKVIPLNNIAGVVCVDMKNKWYEGAGIRYLNGGMLYSINFTNAVELKFDHSQRFIRIGSKTPEALKQAILELSRTAQK